MTAECYSGNLPPVDGGIPKRIGSYDILRVLGRGGMGVVYLGHDSKLDREVAIKGLPREFLKDPVRRSRFEREAKTLASLNHPHIATIHGMEEVDGNQFIVMEYVDGRSLKEALQGSAQTWRDWVEIAACVADALAAAHARGIVHRDLKPDNIRIARDGTVKLLDFGLACTLPNGDEKDLQETTIMADTQPGQIMGTPGYMSPEQVRGQPAGVQSDVFSFGCVLHEMLTGQSPFARDTPADTMAAILTEHPESPCRSGVDLPSELDSVVMRCLRKQPSDRFQSTRDLAFALRSTLQLGTPDPSRRKAWPHWSLLALGAPILVILILALVALLDGPDEAAPIRSLAVLPFSNVSDDPESEFLCEGMAENIINRMGSIEELRVKSRNASFRHAGREDELRAVARELGVEAILTGRITKHGDTLKISVTLQDQDEEQLWGDVIERPVAGILKVESDIAEQIATALNLKLSGAQSSLLTSHPTQSAEAYLAYVEGHFHQYRLERSAYERAEMLYDRAIAADPQFAEAWASKAELYCNRGLGLHSPAVEVRKKATDAAETALTINPNLSEVHQVLGFIHWIWDWDYESAENRLRKAIDLKPDNAMAYQLLAHVLSSQERFGEALAASLEATRLEPTMTLFHSCQGHFYAWNGDLERAMEKMRETVARDPMFGHGHTYLGRELVAQGKPKEGIEEFKFVVNSRRRLGDSVGDLAWAYGRAGMHDDARAAIADLERLAQSDFIPNIAFARAYAGVGDDEQTLDYLEKAVGAREAVLPLIKNESHFRHLSDEPRFIKILKEVGLPH